MLKAPLPKNEAERLAALRELRILDTPPEERYDHVTRLLARLLGVPISLVSLLDEDRQWFKSRVGLEASQTPRDISFCGHAIMGEQPLIVPDAAMDERFHDNPLVTGDPTIRFYAGPPLKGPLGHRIGTLCAIDRKPREMTVDEQELLRDLAAVIEREIALNETVALQQHAITALEAADKLLLCVLPQPIAERMKQGEGSIAECFSEASILFADIQDFSRITSDLAPEKVVGLLNRIFCAFDRLAEQQGLERIKTIGDAYMVAGGIPTPRQDHAEAVARMALTMQREMVHFEAPNGELFNLRIGINTGPVVAGIIGATKFSYDLWGQTVNVASQMESFGSPGCIQVAAGTYQRLCDNFFFEDRGEFYVRGVGDVHTYFLKGEKA